MKLKRTVAECECIPPWYYGRAYRDWLQMHTVYYVIPINVLVAMFRWVRLRWAILRSRPTPYDDQIEARAAKITQARHDSAVDMLLRVQHVVSQR